MIKIDLHLQPSLARAMIDTVRSVRNDLGENLAIDLALPEDDPDLLDAWKCELTATLREDCDFLLETLQRDEFGKGELELKDTTAEGLIRACSAIRLKIREAALGDIDDEPLEHGDLNLADLTFDQQRSYLCYLFLAGLQSEILVEMDPSCEDL